MTYYPKVLDCWKKEITSRFGYLVILSLIRDAEKYLFLVARHKISIHKEYRSICCSNWRYNRKTNQIDTVSNKFLFLVIKDFFAIYDINISKSEGIYWSDRGYLLTLPVNNNKIFFGSNKISWKRQMVDTIALQK